MGSLLRPTRRRVLIAVPTVVVVALITALIGGATMIYRPLPTIDGDYRLVGLDDRAEVVRDQFGVPHIYAKTAHDLFFLQGYVTAQDRLFQMDIYRRTGEGKLAEAVGEPGLESDRFTRTIGFTRAAAADLSVMRPDARAALDAFAEGVNKFIDQHQDALPIEFTILGYRPDHWTPVDTAVIGKLQSFDAAGNYPQELLRASIVTRLGAAALDTLMPDPAGRSASAIDERAWSAVAPLLRGDASAPGLTAMHEFLGGVGNGLESGLGSNCFALAGSRTASGKPILAGDPHLAVRNPSIWYEIGLEGAGYKLVGFSFPGLVAVVIGHNARIAWSLTYAYTSTQDLFVERQDPTDLRRYEFKGAFEPATFLREEIRVKGRGEPVFQNVTITRHGPILTPVLKNQTAQIALRWTALEGGHVIDWVLGVARAGSWAEFRAVGADFVGAAVNACYADVDGHIGYQLLGRLPARPGDGRMPLPGWTGEYEWRGLLPFEANPSVVDPPAAFIVNANDRPVNDPSAVGYVGEWDPGFRGAYLRQVIAPLDRADLPTVGSIQTTFASTPPLRFRDTLLALRPRSQLAAAAQAILRDWDGSLGVDSSGAAIYEAWLVRMTERTFKDKLGDTVYGDFLASGRPTFALYQLVARPADPYFIELGDASVRGRDEIAARALDDAVKDLAAKLGNDPKSWKWGDLHTIAFEHPLSAARPLNLLFTIGPARRGGDGYSVNNGAYSLAKPFAETSHPSERMIVDFADLDASLDITPEGASGQPGSKHWGDQTPLWLAGQYKTMGFSREHLGTLEGTLVFRSR